MSCSVAKLARNALNYSLYYFKLSKCGFKMYKFDMRWQLFVWVDA